MSPHRHRLPAVPLPNISPGELARLLFDWPVRQAPRLALPACIVAAGLLQAGVVLLFSISYPVPAPARIAPPEVYFLPPDSPAARQIAAWLEANDPAVFCPIRSAMQVIPPAPPLKYRPSYEEPPPPLRPLSVTEEPVEPPLPPPDGSALLRPERSLPAAPVSGMGTSVRWLDELASRTPAGAGAEAKPPARTSRCHQQPVFDVGIDASGVPRHCLLVESSGDDTADESLRTWILTRRFAPASSPSWGRVQIVWETPAGAPTP